MRARIYVRPNATASAVGGEFDGALVVRVAEPAESGRATEAALSALAAAIEVPRRNVTLAAGAKSRRKVVEIEAGPGDAKRIENRLNDLRAGPPG